MNFQRLQLSAGPCNGVCPEFSLSIDANGIVVFQGKRNTALVGSQGAELSSERFQRLKDVLVQATSAALAEQYSAQNCPVFNRDRAELLWEIEMRGRKQSIRQNLGCASAADANGVQQPYPAELHNLYREVIELTEARRWIAKPN